VVWCKALPIDLADNVDNARYVYFITVFTGSRLGAGTTSKVYLSIYGKSSLLCQWPSQEFVTGGA